MDPVPGAVDGEPVVPFPHRLPRAELGGQIPPRDPGTEPVNDPLHHLPVITKGPPSLHRPTTASTAQSAPTEHRSAPAARDIPAANQPSHARLGRHALAVVPSDVVDGDPAHRDRIAGIPERGRLLPRRLRAVEFGRHDPERTLRCRASTRPGCRHGRTGSSRGDAHATGRSGRADLVRRSGRPTMAPHDLRATEPSRGWVDETELGRNRPAGQVERPVSGDPQAVGRGR